VKTFRPLIFLILLISLSLACKRSADATPSGETTHTLTFGNLQRSYILYTPQNFDASKPASVVFVFHGGGGNAENAIRMSNFNKVADENGFLVVYPNGTGQLGDSLLTWNAGTCCGFAQRNQIDDIGFVRAILADLQSAISIDLKRVYATGMSNGAMMSHRLACEAADIFAAVAPVSGTLNFSPCQPSARVSVIMFHGTADEHVPYNGGVGDQSLSQVDYVSVQDSVNFWVNFDQCQPEAQVNAFEDVQHQVWSGCADSSSVELYTILGGKHAWPGSDGPGWVGGDEPTHSISATQLIWDFFVSHPKP
jgi:polyhydroxybutyrate depolymerase